MGDSRICNLTKSQILQMTLHISQQLSNIIPISAGQYWEKKDHMGWTRDLCILNNFSNPILTSARSHLSFLKPGSWVRVYSNQKDIEYISAHSFRAAVETPYPVTQFTLFLGWNGVKIIKWSYE